MGTGCRELKQVKIQSCLILAKFEIELGDTAAAHFDSPKAQPVKVETILEERSSNSVFLLKSTKLSFLML